MDKFLVGIPIDFIIHYWRIKVSADVIDTTFNILSLTETADRRYAADN